MFGVSIQTLPFLFFIFVAFSMSTTPLRPKIMFGLFFVLVMLSASFAVNSLTSPSIVAGAPSVDNSQPVTCVDPANSKTAEEKDEVTCTNGTVVVDYCLGSTAVLEYHIIPTSKQLTSTQMPCKAGTVCYDGACMFPNEAKGIGKRCRSNCAGFSFMHGQ